MTDSFKIEEVNLKVGDVCLFKTPYNSVENRVVLILNLSKSTIQILILYGSIMWKYAGDTALLNDNFRDCFTVV